MMRILGCHRFASQSPASVAALVSLGACLIVLGGCGPRPGEEAAGGKERRVPAAPVRVAKAVRQDLPYEIQAIGNVEAYSSVAVKSRVDGQIQRAHIGDGQQVRDGDLLFELDAEPFLEQVRLAEANIARDVAMEKQAEANVVRDAAQAKNARAQAERYESLREQGITAREQADQMRTAAEAAEASLAANQAAIESARAARRADEARLAQARLDLGYTKIHAPISGRAGFINVKEGNLIKENDTVPLVSILRVQPIFVSFAVPEQTLPEIRRHMAAGAPPVEATPPGEDESPVAGRLDSLDNTVDASTGTIRLKAVFPNADLRLWPGQFANVRMRLRIDRQALVVPAKAVQNGLEGTFTWLVRPDLTAEPRKITVVRTHGEQSVIGAGLAEGETVVTEGHLRLTQGVKMEVLGSESSEAPSPTRREARP